ncbi:MAG: GAF domain-containing sensor histidine kinase [Anaerolineales bacterium]|nr:GAF domain-containing sensor histidine kinase [Anaerolineales bacterium]
MSAPQRDLEQHERLQALYHLAVEISALRDLQSVLDTALRHCLSLTDSQFGFIGLNTPDGSAMDVAAIQGFHPAPEFYAHFRLIPLRPSIFARVVLENRPVRSVDAATDPMRVGQPRGHPPVRAFLGVPLLDRDRPIGMIGVANRPTPYDDEHERLLVTYAAQVAIAIRNAQLYEELKAAKEDLEHKVAERTRELLEAKEALAQKAGQLQRLLTETVGVQERERQRIAHDMHDGVNQLLVGALLELKAAHERLGAGDVALADVSLRHVKDILHRVEREIKQIIYDLRPPTLDALGLPPSLRRYAERFTQYSGIPCEVRVEGEPTRLPPDMEIGIYRIMQEALQNVSAHAHARRAEVAIGFSPEAVTLTITDDGQGFDLEAVQRDGHFGLLGMQERAGSLGGRLTIRTAPAQGTRVELFVPLYPVAVPFPTPFELKAGS